VSRRIFPQFCRASRCSGRTDRQTVPQPHDKRPGKAGGRPAPRRAPSATPGWRRLLTTHAPRPLSELSFQARSPFQHQVWFLLGLLCFGLVFCWVSLFVFFVLFYCFFFKLKSLPRTTSQVHVPRDKALFREHPKRSRPVLPVLHGRFPSPAPELTGWGWTPMQLRTHCTPRPTGDILPLHRSAPDRSNIPLRAVLIHIRKSLLMRSDIVMNSLEP